MISIIIPIYNKASVLERCLKSLQVQTYSDIEVLMINDGSKDDSENICKNFENIDKRFIYIYQDNSGVSAARNAGLNIMQGDFFTFIDSDDWVEPEYCQKLLEKTNDGDFDIIFCGTNYCSDGVKRPQAETGFSDIVENRRIEHFLIGHKEYVIGSIWRVLYRRSIFNNLRFDTNFHIYEDLIFLLTALTMTDKMAYVPDHLYNYELSEINYFKKYNRVNYLDICYNIGKKLSEILLQFGYDDWSKAELFKEYCLAADWIYVTEQKKSQKFNDLKKHALAKDFCVKDNYLAYKKLYTQDNLKEKIKAFLLYKKQTGILTLYRNLRNK